MLSRNTTACLVLAGIVLLIGCSKPPTCNRTVNFGGAARCGKLWVSGWNYIMDDSKPTILFCQYADDDSRQIGSFVMVKEHRMQPGSSEHHWKGSVSMHGEQGRVFVETGNDAAKLPIEYRIALKERSTVEDSMKIGDVDYSLDKGRVFQIDLTTTPPQVVQHNLSLPKDTPDIKTTTELEAFARTTLEHLEMASTEVTAFVKSASSK